MSMSTIVNYFVKTGKSIPIHTAFTEIGEFSCKYVDEIYNSTLKPMKSNIILNNETKATLGDASIWIEAYLMNSLKEASAEIQLLFSDLNSVQETMHRSKGALSIMPKLEKGFIKATKNTKGYNSFDDAVKIIGDGIGSRVITKALPKLSKTELDDMIKNTIIDGRKITPEEIKLLRGYLYSDCPGKSSERVFRLYEQFAQPLIEKRSKEVVDRLTAGILKHRVTTEGIDLQVLKENGLFNDDIIKMVELDDVLPLQITEINNYRGAHGLPEFTNGQIQQLSRALNMGKAGSKVKIVSDVRGLDDFLYPAEDIAALSEKSIKASGYRTAQMNVIHANGALGEMQFRGPQTNFFGEYEHIAYDLRQGKNTLGPLFDEYASAISKLSPKQYERYNKYLEECYNYYNRLELGLPAKKPRLPKGFAKVLSEDNMRSLHDKAEFLAKSEAESFSRHVTAVA